MPSRKVRPTAVELPRHVFPITSRCKTYYYFQEGRGTSSEGPRISLGKDPQSPEFWTAYRKALGANPMPAIDTVNSVVDEYLDAVAPTLARSTLVHYRAALGIARRAWGTLPIEGLRPSHVKKLMDGLASTPAKANQFLSVMKTLSGWAIVSEKITQSMTEGVKAYATDGGHRPWSDAQVAIALEKLTGAVRRGVMLYISTGQRGQDVVKLGPTYVDDGGFNLGQTKTGVKVWCPIVSELAAEMETWERRPGPYVRQADGKPYTRKLFGEHFGKAVETIPELADVTLHGLRCTAVVRLRHAGLSVPQISDIVGMSLATVTRYCRFADRKISGKEALARIEEHRESKAKREGIKNVK
jgi:integrase